MWIKEYMKEAHYAISDYPNINIEFFDRVFVNQMRQLYILFIKAYE
jgi:hypothetical protein